MNHHKDVQYKIFKSKGAETYKENECDFDDTICTVEIAVSKYVIQPGDTLNTIAEKYNTSVEELLKQNQNITNANIIYAGDYLVIKWKLKTLITLDCWIGI